MKPAQIAFGLILIIFTIGLALLMTSCADIGKPQFCVKTEYGEFCYSLPSRTLNDK